MADTTVRRHLDQLAGTFALRVLKPWHENIGKRQVKARRGARAAQARFRVRANQRSFGDSALNDLKLDSLVVVHAGPHNFPMAPRVRAVAFRNLLTEIRVHS